MNMADINDLIQRLERPTQDAVAIARALRSLAEECLKQRSRADALEIRVAALTDQLREWRQP